MATAFGHHVDVQTGKGSELITATNEFITAFLDSKNIGLDEIPLILCMLEQLLYLVLYVNC